MHKLLSITLLLTLALVASGCSVYNVAMDERSVGAQANDENITFLIKKKFLEDDNISYLDFDAASYHGHVYLVGEYENNSQVDTAVRIARSVEGVGTITKYMLPKNELDYCGTTDNLEIYGWLKQELVSDGDIWSTNVNIKVVQCNVVLLGIVGSTREMNKIISYAKQTKGVRKVTSYLKVKRM